MLKFCRALLWVATTLIAFPVVMPAELPGLKVEKLEFKPGSKTHMTWNTSAAARYYGLYRGRILPEGEFFRRYNHRCLATELGRSWGEDPDLPEPGSAFYYLASGLRPGGTPSDMDWGPLGTNTVVRPEGHLPCGRRIFVDPAATGTGDGSSWANAYNNLSSAVAHPSPAGRSLEMWLTGKSYEYVTSSRGQLVFYGGFQGNESYAWKRSPQTQPFLWKAAPSAPSDLFSNGPLGQCENFYYLFDGIEFAGGKRGIRILLSGQRVEILRSIFRDQKENAVYLQTPSDYMCGIETFVDQSKIYGSSAPKVFGFHIEGGDHGDLRIHRSLLKGNESWLLDVTITDGLFNGKARVELVGNEIVGGDPGMSLLARCWNSKDSTIDLALASNLLHDTAGNGIEMTAEGGSGNARIRGLIAGNTISNIAHSGVSCSLSASGGTAACTPELDSNILSFCNDFAIQEPNDAAAGLSGDQKLVGNDLFENGIMILDEGSTKLNTIAQVNALSGNWGNINEDPLYVNVGAGDYHLQPGSPLIDSCVIPLPVWVLIDSDHKCRVQEGDGIAPIKCDLGADEFEP